MSYSTHGMRHIDSAAIASGRLRRPAFVSCGIDPGQRSFAICIEAVYEDGSSEIRLCNIYDLGDKSSMVNNLIRLFEEIRPELEMASSVNIEGQLRSNVPMARLEGVVVAATAANTSVSCAINVVSTSRKDNLLKNYFDINRKVKRQELKSLAIRYAMEQAPNEPQFRQKGKRDDMADAFIYCQMR